MCLTTVHTYMMSSAALTKSRGVRSLSDLVHSEGCIQRYAQLSEPALVFEFQPFDIVAPLLRLVETPSITP